MNNSLSNMRHETEFLVSQILAVAPSSSKAIQKVLQAIGESLFWEVGIFWKFDEDLQKIRCDQIWASPSTSSLQFLTINQKSLFLPGMELPGEVWESRKPRWVTDITHASHFLRAPYAIEEGFKTAIDFPICLGEKRLGIMEFFSKQTKVVDKNILQTLDAISGQLSQFIERKAVENQLQLAYQEMEHRVQKRTEDLVKSNQALQLEIAERKKVEKEILEVAQKEQRRLGSQLHDGLCQELTGILMFAKGLTQKMERENRFDIAELKQISDLLDSAVSQARNTARGLYPGELHENSLMDMLEELTSSTQNLSGISCRFHCPEPVFIPSNDNATHLYKIAQEGILNAVKHSKTQSIEVSLTKNGNNIVLTIKDEGVGYVDDPEYSKGIGLKIMKYRAHMMDASFQIGPNVPHGIMLTCILKGIL